MMREILFRGKRVDNGEWVCSGNLIHFNEGNECYIPVKNSNCTCTHDINDNIIEWNEVMFCKVIPETVGQYTGLTDKNGKRIFEGDIIKTHYANTPRADFIEQVVFHNGRFTGMYENGKMKMWAGLPDKEFKRLPQDKSVYMEWCEVIGNIHDNKELLHDCEV